MTKEPKVYRDQPENTARSVTVFYAYHEPIHTFIGFCPFFERVVKGDPATFLTQLEPDFAQLQAKLQVDMHDYGITIDREIVLENLRGHVSSIELRRQMERQAVGK